MAEKKNTSAKSSGKGVKTPENGTKKAPGAGKKSASKGGSSGRNTNSGAAAAKGGNAKKTSSGGAPRQNTAGHKEKNGSAKKTGLPDLGILRGNDSRSRIIRTGIKLIIVLLAIIAVIGLWRNRVDWSCVNISQCAKDMPMMTGSGDGFPVTVMGSHVFEEEELSGGIAVLTDTNMVVYNTSSKMAVSRAHYLSSPAMKTAGRYAVLFDIGGTKYRLETVSDTLVSGSADYPLIGCAVSRNGSFAVVMQGSSYASRLSSVEVFDHAGESRYKWHSSDYYITDAALTGDGKYIAMSGLSAKDGGLLSCIFIHKVHSNSELMRYELPDTVCLSLGFTNSGTLFVICSDRVVIVKNYGDNISEIPIEGQLQAYDINYDYGALIYTVAVSDNESGTLTAFDTRGDKRFESHADLHGLAVSMSEEGCCVLGRGGIAAFELDGDAIGLWDAEVSATDVLLIGSKAYVVEGVSISQVRLNRDFE